MRAPGRLQPPFKIQIWEGDADARRPLSLVLSAEAAQTHATAEQVRRTHDLRSGERTLTLASPMST
jgi:hypothetical protein